MAPTHVRILELFALHEPPSPRPLPLRGGEGARRAGEGAVHGPNACEKRKRATHEPQGRAGCPQPAGPRRGEDTAPYQLARFMAPTHVQSLEVFPSHEPSRLRVADPRSGPRL